MKKIITVITSAFMAIMLLSGCGENKEYLQRRCEELKNEIAELQEEKRTLETEIIDIKEENGTARYVVTFRVKQSHFTLDIGEHIKDAINEITIEIPVDKEYYDNLSVGDIISNEFRTGSLIMHGSFGNWNISVDKKEIK